MTTNRVPINRPAVAQVTDRAIDLFVAMCRLRCTCPTPRPPELGPCPGCAEWWDLHDLLDDEIGGEPWEWPVISRQGPKHAGDTCMNEGIAARMAMLKAAAKARRTAVSARKEEDTDAKLAADRDPAIP